MEKYIGYWNVFLSTFLKYLPSLIVAMLIWLIGSWVINRVVKVFQKTLTKRKFDISLESFLISLANIGLRILLLFTVASQLGIQTTSFVAILGAASLAVGLALQGTLANFAGGILILVFRPYKVGDIIEAQGQSGKVVEIQIFNTVLHTLNSKTVIIPNGILSNGIIVNDSEVGTIVFDIRIEVDRNTSLEHVKNILSPIFTSEPKILASPTPGVGIANFGNGYFLTISGHTLTDDQVGVVGRLNEKIAKAFTENKITAPEAHTFIHNR
jgi:small conductance mechanosensitive channel